MHKGMTKPKLSAVQLPVPRDIDAKIKAWREAELFAIEAHEAAQSAMKSAFSAAIPAKIRPAAAEDIVVGAIVWYPGMTILNDRLNVVCKWREVERTLLKGDRTQAFQATGGTRHGLDGAFVEVE